MLEFDSVLPPFRSYLWGRHLLLQHYSMSPVIFDDQNQMLILNQCSAAKWQQVITWTELSLFYNISLTPDNVYIYFQPNSLGDWKCIYTRRFCPYTHQAKWHMFCLLMCAYVHPCISFVAPLYQWLWQKSQWGIFGVWGSLRSHTVTGIKQVVKWKF